MNDSRVEEERGPQPVELIRRVRVGEGQHAADVPHAGDLRAERRLAVEGAADPAAELLGAELAAAVDADAAWSRQDLAGDVRGRADREGVVLVLKGRLPTDRPLGDVVRPLRRAIG